MRYTVSEMQPPEGRGPEAEPPLRVELADMARARIRFVASVALDVAMLAVIVPILAAFEWFRAHFQLHGLNEWFVVATEVLTTGGTFATIAFYVSLDVRVAYRRFKSVGQGDRRD